MMVLVKDGPGEHAKDVGRFKEEDLDEDMPLEPGESLIDMSVDEGGHSVREEEPLIEL